MSVIDEAIYVEIVFQDEDEDTAIDDLAAFLSQIDNLYHGFEANRDVIRSHLPSDLDEGLIYDEDERDKFIGRLYQSNVFSDIGYNNNASLIPSSRNQTEYEWLSVKRLRKESPLLIGITGGGVFAAVLWIIAGLEVEDGNFRLEKNSDGFEFEVSAEWKFNATSTKELVEEIRKFLK